MTTPKTVNIAQLIKYGASDQIKKSSSTAAKLPFFADKSLRVDGLYLHIPFCFHKCHYCDFYSLVDQPVRHDQFVTKLKAELAAVAPKVTNSISTIFVGGGTPTLLAPERWRDLLAALREHYQFTEDYEFTVEANPETVTPELIDTLVAGGSIPGVNRFSIGAQSFNPAHLKTLERWHDPANVTKAVNTIRAAGVENFNLDLIFAIPGQSLDDWRNDLETAIALNPQHLSCYGLMYEPNTPMTARLKRGEFARADEDLEADMYALTIDTLARAGFEHYEISNWAKTNSLSPRERASSSPLPLGEGGPGVGTSSSSSLSSWERAGVRASANSHLHQNTQFSSARCRHNLLYWHNKNWWPFGPSASGHFNGWRWKNVPRLTEYLEGPTLPNIQDVEHLDSADRIGETLMLRLRLIEGIPNDELHALLPDDDARHAVIQKYIDSNHLVHDKISLRFTREGLYIADSVLTDLL